MPTCWARDNAQPSRIDAILVNPQAIRMVRAFEVERSELIPTHGIVRIRLNRAALKEERTYAKTLPSLKKMFDKKMEEDTKGMDDKGKTEHIKEQKKILHKKWTSNY